MTGVVRIFESELRVLAHEVLMHPRIETGGSLFGLWSHGDGPTVFLASRPGLAAVHEVALFQQHPQTHRDLEQALWSAYGVQCIGLWHSHHQLGLHELSSGDLRRTAGYSARHNRRRFCDILCYIADDGTGRQPVHVKPHLFEDAAQLIMLNTRLEVLPGTSPLRMTLDELAAPASIHGTLTSAPDRVDMPTAVAGVARRALPAATAEGPSEVNVLRRLMQRIQRSPEPAEPTAQAPDAEPATTAAPAKPPRTLLIPIGDPEVYIDRFLSPHLRRAPESIDCAVKLNPGEHVIDVVLSSANRHYVHLRLAFDGVRPIVVEARHDTAAAGPRTRPAIHPDSPTPDLRAAFNWAYNLLAPV